MGERPLRDGDIGSRADLSRRRVLQGMLAGAGALAAGGLARPWAAQAAARSSGALLPPGTRPYPSVPEGQDMLPQIENIVIYMQENQSFDHYFGSLGRGDGFTYGPDGQPTNFNLDGNGNPVRAFHVDDTCNSISGDHSWNGTHLSINGGRMDGFAKDSGPMVMGYYDQTNLPFYHGLASTFPLCDRWFCSVPGPTYPNRRFLQAATSVGIIATDINEIFAVPNAPNGTIWNRLDAHGITWKDYAIDGLDDILLFPTSNLTKFLADTADNRRPYSAFLTDCAAGTLPQVSILAPGVHDQYDEGSRDVHNGERYSASIMSAVMNGPQWRNTAILFTWDEHGGGYDHVPPPAAAAPDNIAPRTHAGDQPGDFGMYGVRVGGLVISPWSRSGYSPWSHAGSVKPGQNYISHVVHDHTSILRFLETKWNLGAMTYRDANADNLLDCFDFTTPNFLEPPDLPLPALTTTESVCQPQPLLPITPKSSHPYPHP